MYENCCLRKKKLDELATSFIKTLCDDTMHDIDLKGHPYFTKEVNLILLS